MANIKTLESYGNHNFYVIRVSEFGFIGQLGNQFSEGGWRVTETGMIDAIEFASYDNANIAAKNYSFQNYCIERVIVDGTHVFLASEGVNATH